MEINEIIEYNAFNPDAFINYQTPADIEQNKKILKYLIIFLVLLVVISLIHNHFQNKD